MAGLMTAHGGLVTSHSPGMAAPRRPTIAPVASSSPSGVRDPKMIMQERAAREARQRVEAEKIAFEQSRADQEARLLRAGQAEDAERRHASAAAGKSGASQARQPTEPRPRAQYSIAEPRLAERAPAPTTATATATAVTRPLPSQVSGLQQPMSPQKVTAGGPQKHPPSGEGSATAQADGPSSRPIDVIKPGSFPHAFERWETLSAHWEGLSSYWIRKLEQNKDDVNRDPLSQQLARQVTDLSAAGANLFHAVLELQRLRASSERKFQRWFFETRSELERAQEVNAMLEAALQKEKDDRAEALRDAVERERGSSKAQKQLAEMRKELAISKEEARRAWEELGRREQAERDRTFSLQMGQPTTIGGVQVVPMNQGGLDRHVPLQDDDHSYHGGMSPSYTAEHHPATPPKDVVSPMSSFIEGSYRAEQQRLAETGGSAHLASEAGGYSEGDYVIDAQGNLVLDIHGNKIPYAVAPASTAPSSEADADEYETTPATTQPPSGGHEAIPNTAGEAPWSAPHAAPQDYSGQGYGAPGWETVPRHHQPNRLSDVMEEEDKRSRTGASQLSRG